MSAGLSAHFRAPRSETFVLDVELEVPGGSTTALVGPNGAGKSTLVSVIAGLLPIDRGRLVLDGTVLADPAAGLHVPPRHRRLGVLFQGDLLFPHFSVLDNVAFGPRSRGMRRETARSHARCWLERVGLAELEGRAPRSLSGGQARRVALARTLASDPRMVLLDEPLRALDVGTRALTRRLLSDHLAGVEGPRLWITHDPTEAFMVADRIAIMEDGRIVQVGTADAIRLQPRSRYAAQLVGVNLLRGSVAGDRLAVGTVKLHVAEKHPAGPASAIVHPTAISVHRREPTGSPRNSWRTTIQQVERWAERVRLQVGPPVPMTIEITESARTDLGLAPGTEVWVAIKATEITVTPDAEPSAEAGG